MPTCITFKAGCSLTHSRLSWLSQKRPHLLMLFQVSTAASSSLNAAGRNAVMTSLIICCGFIACWSFAEILGILLVIGYTTDPSGWFHPFSMVMVFINSCINPFIYAAKYYEFQAGIRRLRAQVNPWVSASGVVWSWSNNDQQFTSLSPHSKRNIDARRDVKSDCTRAADRNDLMGKIYSSVDFRCPCEIACVQDYKVMDRLQWNLFPYYREPNLCGRRQLKFQHLVTILRKLASRLQ